MHLTLSDIAQLPLPAALFGRDSELITHTPEWRGAVPGTVTYRVRGNRLLVASGEHNPICDGVLSRLLDELDTAVLQVSGLESLQVRMLATSLRVVAGRTVDGEGTSDHVLHFARAGIRARTGLDVAVEAGETWPLTGVELAALVLVQLAANAERHAGATAVTLSESTDAFHVGWPGQCDGARATTSRRRAERARWGLGFARLAADALGGAVYPPHQTGGHCTATLELGLGRLSLPLAAVRRGVIAKASRAWDEETRLLPGSAVASDQRLEHCCALAHQARGEIAAAGGWRARAVGETVWIAIPADDVRDRARDVIDGITHERALWASVADPLRSRVVALAAVLGSLVGAPLQRCPAGAWTQRMSELAPAFGVRTPIPACRAAGALDPTVTALLASEVGASFAVEGEKVWLVVRPDARWDPLARALAPDAGDRIAIA